MKRFLKLPGIFVVFPLTMTLLSGWGCSRNGSGHAGLVDGMPGTGKAGRAVPDTIRFVDPVAGDLVCSGGQAGTGLVLGPWKTNLVADSVLWEVTGIPGGICLEPASGKGDRAGITLLPGKTGSGGVIMVKATPFRRNCIPRPALFAYSLKIMHSPSLPGIAKEGHSPGPGKPEACFHAAAAAKLPAGKVDAYSCKPDTATVNLQRRKKIAEFRDLLFMFSNTANSKEKEFFKTGALKKLQEFPGKTAGILPGIDTGHLFTEPFPPDFSVLPVYDVHGCYITGVKVIKR